MRACERTGSLCGLLASGLAWAGPGGMKERGSRESGVLHAPLSHAPQSPIKAVSARRCFTDRPAELAVQFDGSDHGECIPPTPSEAQENDSSSDAGSACALPLAPLPSASMLAEVQPADVQATSIQFATAAAISLSHIPFSALRDIAAAGAELRPIELPEGLEVVQPPALCQLFALPHRAASAAFVSTPSAIASPSA